MTKSQIRLPIYLLLAIFIAAIIGHLLDIEWLNYYCGFLVFIDELIFTVLVVIHGKNFNQRPDKSKAPKLFLVAAGTIFVLILMGGLLAIILKNVDFKQVQNFELWNVVKLMYFGSQLLAVPYYLFTKKR